MSRPLFSLGQLVFTPGALSAMQAEGTNGLELLRRHARGDWGNLDAHDQRANRQALVSGARLLSSYELPKTQQQVWVITEADRSTTFLLPDEY